ncbi:sulfotransferase family cytosolic 1B member 1-like isoform X2 [Gigantopelta aegis]|nr:sulfotransferase family cytosolic 1B member 1-like isoform X2 [Gigantopelta aegis]
MPLVKYRDAGGDTLLVLEVDGYLYPKTPEEVVRGIKDVTIRDDDVMICAYPKSGTHWVWEITRCILSGTTDLVVAEKDELHLECIPNSTLETFASPRILNCHIWYRQLPGQFTQKNCKIIFVSRNPKDVAVSFFHHHKKLTQYYEYTGKWENYLPLFLNGQVDSGSWFEYMLDWEAAIANNATQPILVLRYEDIEENPQREVSKIARFLDKDCTAEFLSQVCDKCDFRNMKRTKGHIITSLDDKNDSVMYRKGQVGDWKNYFTVAQNEVFDRVFAEKMKQSSMKFKYEL